jgi:dienelactone hydrolase
MVRLFRLFLSCLIALSIPIGICASDNADHQERLSKHYRLEKPAGAGPFPSVMMVPGCSGFDAEFQKAFYDSVQNQFVELGFVTLRVDYLATRNFSSCAGNVSTDTVGDDIRIAAGYLKQQSFVKKGTINVVGWSYGGAGALQALRLTNSQKPAQVDSVVAYYPYCAGVQLWDSEVPVLVLVGAIDNVNPLSKCESIFGKLPKRDKLTIRVYKDAHHGFDNFTLPAEMQYRFGTLGYNDAAAKSAWKEATNFLRR